MTEGIVRVGTIVGGLSKEKQKRVLKNRPEIIVATPGRLWEMVSHITFLRLASLVYRYVRLLRGRINHRVFIVYDLTSRMKRNIY